MSGPVRARAHSVVVTNPGTHPHLQHLAVELARRGPLRYLTSSSWAADSVLQRMLRLPVVRTLPGASGLRRRALPAGLRPRQVVRLATVAEVLFFVSRNLGLRSSDTRMETRTARFESAAASRIRRLRPRVVIAEYTGATAIFRSAPRNVVRVLDYPIAHHGWMDRELETEAVENPEWAPFLQGRGMDDSLLARLDGEIEAADLVLVPSRFVERTFVEMGVPAEKLLVSNLGSDEVAAGGPARGDRGDSGPLRLIFAGQVTQRKGLSYLLEAVERTPGVELLIVGHQPPGMADMLRGRDRVTVSPSVDRATLDGLYDDADLLVLPSLAEGFPLVAIGALSRGTPLVVTDSAAAEDLIEDGVHGFRVPARDAGALAHVLATAAADRGAVRRMRAAAAERGREFTWEAYANRTADLIEQRVADR